MTRTFLALLVLLLSGEAEAQRIPLSQALYLYVDPALGNDTGDCRGQGAGACKTIEAAYQKIRRNYDHSYPPAIRLADGIYDAGLNVHGHLVGAHMVSVIGNASHPSSVVIRPPPGPAFVAQDGAIMAVRSLRIEGPGVVGFQARQLAILDVDDIVFGEMPGGTGITAADGGFVNLTGPFHVAGSMAAQWQATGQSRITVGHGVTYTIHAAVNIGVWAVAADLSLVTLGGEVKFNGKDAVSGMQYVIASGSLLRLRGCALPGSSGATYTGGQVQ